MKVARKESIVKNVLEAVLILSLFAGFGYSMLAVLDKPQVMFSVDSGKPMFIVDSHGAKTPIDKDHPVPRFYEKVWVEK